MLCGIRVGCCNRSSPIAVWTARGLVRGLRISETVRQLVLEPSTGGMVETTAKARLPANPPPTPPTRSGLWQGHLEGHHADAHATAAEKEHAERNRVKNIQVGSGGGEWRGAEG